MSSWELPDEQVGWEQVEKNWAARKEDDEFIRRLEQGRQGFNAGFDNGLTRINTYIHGTHRGRYILIGADSGSGKTTAADFMYLYSLWRATQKAGIKLHVIYFSFELSATEKKAKWTCQWIKAIYGIDLPVDYVMGRIPGLMLSEEHLRMVMRAYSVVQEMLKDIDLCDNLLHPTGMLQRVLAHYEQSGTILRDEPKEGHSQGYIRGYKANDPTDFTLIVTDHLALINPEKGAPETKSCMDRWSMYSVMLRNVFQTTIVNIQQFSTSMMDAYRKQKATEAAIAPQRLDFGDSTYTYRDADLVLGLVMPLQFNLQRYHEYDLKQLGNTFVACYIMKNRYGPANKVLPLFMNPVSGMFWDMPLSAADPGMVHYYNEAKRIEELCQHYSSLQGTNP